MPSTILLTAVPAKFLRDPGAITHTLIVKPFGKKYGLAVRSIATLDDIKRCIAEFADAIGERFPDHSFSVTLRFRGGDRPPEGYDEALKSGLLGQNRYTQFFDVCSADCLAQDYFGPESEPSRA